jgi:hypothetical protein
MPLTTLSTAAAMYSQKAMFTTEGGAVGAASGAAGAPEYAG